MHSLLVVLLLLGSTTADDPWMYVDQLLQSKVDDLVFPGCAAAVVNETHFLYFKTFGRLTYGEPAPMSMGKNPLVNVDTRYDLASLTKVLATTTATMMLYQKGYIDINMLVSDAKLLGPSYVSNGKENIKILNLLLHNAGFPPDPVPDYWQLPFGCEQTSHYHPAEVFTCRPKIYKSVLAQTLIYPTGSKYIYSDLSMITLMFAIGNVIRTNKLVPESALRKECMAVTPSDDSVSQCYYEAFINNHVLQYLGLNQTGFLPPQSAWGNSAPTWYNPYRHLIAQGTVSDGNSYALGGIAGHAGFYSTVGDIQHLLRVLMFHTNPSMVNATTLKHFTTVHNTTQSSRALGWDTNNYQANHYRGCGTLSSTTYTHTGYTGTQVCNDPERKLITVLLTNRCYPDDTHLSKREIHTARQEFNNMVQQILDHGHI